MALTVLSFLKSDLDSPPFLSFEHQGSLDIVCPGSTQTADTVSNGKSGD